MKTLALMIALAAIACGNKTEDKPAAAKSIEGSPQAAVTPAVGSGSGSAIAAAPALSPKIKAARCGEPCLFLVDTPLDKLVDTYKAECGGMVTKDLGFDDCRNLDYNRNCIYAAHGLVFKEKKWKQFAKQRWYDANPAFQASSISELERANVHELNQRGKACKKGLHISGADYERVKAWLEKLPKADFPPVILEGEELDEARKMSRDDLVALLRTEFAGDDPKKKIRLPSNAVASYDTEISPVLLTALGSPKDKLRVIVIDVDAGTVGDEENPITEGTYVRFVYDETDKLRAITAFHYLWD